MKNRLFVFFTRGETQSHPTGNLGISGITAWAPSCERICCGGDRGHVQPLLCKSKQLNEGAEIQTQKVGTQ